MIQISLPFPRLPRYNKKHKNRERDNFLNQELRNSGKLIKDIIINSGLDSPFVNFKSLFIRDHVKKGGNHELRRASHGWMADRQCRVGGFI
jgi:hypothetical protein